MGMLPRADCLRLSFHHEGRSLTFAYGVDDRFIGEIKVHYPFAFDDAEARHFGPIGLGVAAFIGQLCLAKRIELDFALPTAALPAIAPIIEMLYDARCQRDRRDIVPSPVIEAAGVMEAPPLRNLAYARRACLLWSGGKDSTLSALVLRRNGLDVHAAHLAVNAGVETTERATVEALAPYLAIPVDTVDFEFPQFLELSGAYATKWDKFPQFIRVPFGRDLLAALLAVPIAGHQRARFLCMGHDHDCRVAYVTYQGKSIPRDDVESVRGALALESFIQQLLNADLTLLPPLAGVSEFRILHELLVRHPDLMKQTTFCFWGRQCGQCGKCMRYYLAGRVLGREDVLHFPLNPLAGLNAPSLVDFVVDWRNESALRREEVLYGLGRLVQRGDVRTGEDLLVRFRDEVFPYVVGDLDIMEERLMKTYSDPQVPADFLVL
jgi:hypothetical protein